MSVKIVHEEIKRFLKSPEPEVLCLKGKWGVGKTYAWNHYLQEAAENGELGMEQYAYASLFGMKSLEDIKYALFEGTIDAIQDLEKGPSTDTLQISIDWIKKNFRKGVTRVSQLPVVQGYIGTSERSLFFLVRNQIVCIDDLERAGEGLDPKDVLGLVSNLKEERKCKVVLLMNDEKLTEENKNILKELLEKVVDTRLDFSPTPTEAADIVFPSPEGVRKLLHKNCVALGITNIRIIKKIERIVLRLEEIFEKDSPVLTQAVHSATLFGWTTFQPDIAPPIEFLKDFSRLHGLMTDKDKTPTAEKAWQDLMRTYEYSSSDEFDLTILETIENGYFDTDKLKAAEKKSQENMGDAQSKKAFQDAWSMYHDSFENNDSAMLDAMYSTGMQNAKFIEPTNLDSTLGILKEFGRTKEAKELLDHYLKVRGDEKDLFDLSRSVFTRDVKDPDLIAKFRKKRESYQDTRSPAQVLINISARNGWNPEDTELLKKLTTDDFYKIFKELKGVDLHRAVRSALDFGKIGGIPESERAIAQPAIEALKRIGKESKLNAKRVRNQGIEVED